AGLDVLEAHASRAYAHPSAQPRLGRDAGESDAQPSRQDRQRIAAPLEVGDAAKSGARAQRKQAAALPDRARGIAERKRSATRALERESDPRSGRIRQKKNQIRDCAHYGQPDAGTAKSAGHEPCARNSIRPFTVPGLAPLSSVALSARRPVCCCSSTSHDTRAWNGASSICKRTAFAPSASTRFSCPRRPCRSAACPTATAGLAGSV